MISVKKSNWGFFRPFSCPRIRRTCVMALRTDFNFFTAAVSCSFAGPCVVRLTVWWRVFECWVRHQVKKDPGGNIKFTCRKWQSTGEKGIAKSSETYFHFRCLPSNCACKGMRESLSFYVFTRAAKLLASSKKINKLFSAWKEVVFRSL